MGKNVDSLAYAGFLYGNTSVIAVMLSDTRKYSLKLIKRITLFSYNISYIKNWNDFDQTLYSKILRSVDRASWYNSCK
jgi:hypothetical protein